MTKTALKTGNKIQLHSNSSDLENDKHWPKIPVTTVTWWWWNRDGSGFNKCVEGYSVLFTFFHFNNNKG